MTEEGRGIGNEPIWKDKPDHPSNPNTKRPHLTLMQGGLSEGQEAQQIKPRRFTRIRRIFANVLKKLDTNPQNIPPTGKAF